VHYSEALKKIYLTSLEVWESITNSLIPVSFKRQKQLHIPTS